MHDVFIFAQNIDSGYTLDTKIRRKKKENTLVNPSFFYIKIGCKGGVIMMFSMCGSSAHFLFPA